MVQDQDENQMCSNSSSGGGSKSSSSKKLKQKKVPQRGLGVAQLEKIRVEELQKKDSTNHDTNFPSPSTLSPTNSSSFPMVTFPNYPSNNQSQSSMMTTYHPPSPSLNNLPSPNTVFRTRSMPNFESFHLGSTISTLNPINDRGFNIGLPSNFPKLWNSYEFNPDHKGENSRLDYHGLSYGSNFGPLPNVLPSNQHYQQPSSSLMNVSSMNSLSSSSSALNFPMEPPSNQSYYSNYSPLWPDEEKMMVGMKRSCPFPIDNPQIPTFHSKFAPMAPHPISRSDDQSISCGNGATTFNFDLAIFREVPSCPSAMPDPGISKKISKSENGNSNGEFLTLAPPTIISPFSSSKFKHPPTFQPSYNRELCNFDTLPYQATGEDSIIINSGQVSSQQPNFFSFFPSTKVQVGSAASSPSSHGGYNGEVGESVDLNLRL